MKINEIQRYAGQDTALAALTRKDRIKSAPQIKNIFGLDFKPESCRLKLL